MYILHETVLGTPYEIRLRHTSQRVEEAKNLIREIAAEEMVLADEHAKRKLKARQVKRRARTPEESQNIADDIVERFLKQAQLSDDG